jgi:hypothetical protein
VTTRSDEYKSKAAQCLELAQRIGDTNSKAMLLEMAQRWVELADHVQNASFNPDGENGG